ITAAGFLPIATAKSSTGEYTRSIFEVVTIALLISWVAAVVLIPYLGYKLLPEHGAPPSRFENWLRLWRKRALARMPASLRGGNARNGNGHAHDPYATPFYRRFRALVDWCVGNRKTVIVSTVLMFVLSIAGFGLVQQQFFPDSTRPE